MNAEEVQDIIFEELTQEFPRLTIETIHEIMEIVGDGWDWEERFLPTMRRYIQNKICIFTEEELIDFGDELYDEDYYDGYIEGYIDDLQNRKFCVVWKGEQYKRADEICDLEETEEIYIYCE